MPGRGLPTAGNRGDRPKNFRKARSSNDNQNREKIEQPRRARSGSWVWQAVSGEAAKSCIGTKKSGVASGSLDNREALSGEAAKSCIGVEKSEVASSGVECREALSGEAAKSCIGVEKSAAASGSLENREALSGEAAKSCIGVEKSEVASSGVECREALSGEAVKSCIGVEKSMVAFGSLVNGKALCSEAAEPCIGVERSAVASGCLVNGKALCSEAAEPCIGVERSAVVSGSLVNGKALYSEAAESCIGVDNSNEASLCNLEWFIKAVVSNGLECRGSLSGEAAKSCIGVEKSAVASGSLVNGKALYSEAAEPCVGVENSAVVAGSLVHMKGLSSEAAKSCKGVEKSNEASLCNLERFIKAATPSVPARCFPETTMRGMRSSNEESQPYFELGDLWESFRNSSAYGAEVSLLMNGCDVKQYYNLYLSAIQLYGDSCSSASTSRQSEESDNHSSSCIEPRQAEYNSKLQTNTLMTNDMERLSLMPQHREHRGGSSSDEIESPNSPGHLLFEYFEMESPYTREPLFDKISNLAQEFPQLRTLRSCDLLCSSWISVAWYPIYGISARLTLKKLETGFLTFHSLHTPIEGASNPMCPIVCPTELHSGLLKMSLPAFGLCTYKLKGAPWVPYGGSQHTLLHSLSHSADSWLKSLQVQHKHRDFLFFWNSM
ncbi:unnamed protein product [Rhodiola kirilowii]